MGQVSEMRNSTIKAHNFMKKYLNSLDKISPYLCICLESDDIVRF